MPFRIRHFCHHRFRPHLAGLFDWHVHSSDATCVVLATYGEYVQPPAKLAFYHGQTNQSRPHQEFSQSIDIIYHRYGAFARDAGYRLCDHFKQAAMVLSAGTTYLR